MMHIDLSVVPELSQVALYGNGNACLVSLVVEPCPR